MRLTSIYAVIVSIAVAIAFPALAADIPKTTLESADKLLAAGALPEAARAYAAFARDFPKDSRAPRAFADAVIMNSRLARVDIGIAQSDLQYFENSFVPVNLDIWAEVAFTLIDGFVVRNDRRSALALLHRTMAVRDQFAADARKKKTPDLQTLREIEIRARGKMAHVYTEMGDHRGAEIEYTHIQKLIGEMGVWPGKKRPRAMAKYAETMEFAAESFFHAAEQKRFEAERLHLPAYIGSGDRASVLAYNNGPGKIWYDYRKFAVEEANRLYALVIGVELPKPEPPKPPTPSAMIGLVGGDPNAPVRSWVDDDDSRNDDDSPPPSPRWAIAAAERVGRLWTNFVREFRTMPIPKEWKGSGMIPGTDITYEELKGEYISYIDPPDEVQKQQAKHAYKLCLDLSMKHQIVNEHTRACIHWLSKNYGAEYHEIDDFAPPGEFFALGIVPRPAPLLSIIK